MPISPWTSTVTIYYGIIPAHSSRKNYYTRKRKKCSLEREKLAFKDNGMQEYERNL
jgi:hypothetical protein